MNNYYCGFRIIKNKKMIDLIHLFDFNKNLRYFGSDRINSKSDILSLEERDLKIHDHFYNYFLPLSEERFNKILMYKYYFFRNLNVKLFFKKNGWEEYLI